MFQNPFETQNQNRGGPEGARRTSAGTSSNMKKASSITNIVDDLTSIFGGNFILDVQLVILQDSAQAFSLVILMGGSTNFVWNSCPVIWRISGN